MLVFNLIPAFPLDGGRIARAIIWRPPGDRRQATQVAAALGQGFAYILIGLGVAVLVGASSLRGIGHRRGVWLIFIGMFLGQARARRPTRPPCSRGSRASRSPT